MEDGNQITVRDIDIPFLRLVAIFIKFGLAAIPAAIIVSVIMSVVLALLGGIFGGFHAGWMMGGPRV